MGSRMDVQGDSGQPLTPGLWDISGWREELIAIPEESWHGKLSSSLRQDLRSISSSFWPTLGALPHPSEPHYFMRVWFEHFIMATYYPQCEFIIAYGCVLAFLQYLSNNKGYDLLSTHRSLLWAKCFSCIISLNLYNNPSRQELVLPFYR